MSATQSVFALKAGYAALAVAFSVVLLKMLLGVMAAEQPKDIWVAGIATAVGFAGLAVGSVGWVLGRRLGLSHYAAAAVAFGSVWCPINVAVFFWVILKRPIAPAEGTRR